MEDRDTKSGFLLSVIHQNNLSLRKYLTKCSAQGFFYPIPLDKFLSFMYTIEQALAIANRFVCHRSILWFS